jgi:ABC-type spermidine/putrescine transport system permease subunit I
MAALVVVLILGALVAVLSRAELGAGLGPADYAAVRFTVWQAFLSSLISVLLAIPVARALARRRFFGRGVLVTLLGAPFILPAIVAVLGLLMVFGRNGWLNAALEMLGLPAVSIYGLHGVVLAHVFFNLPLATRLLLQGWQGIPAERFRLAAQLRLTPGATFRTLEWPVLTQIVPGAAALIFVICLTSFAVALTLGGGPRATTIELAIFQAFRFDFDLGRAALLSVTQLVLAGAAAAFALWIIPVVNLGGGQDRPLQRWDARGGMQFVLDGVMIALAAAFLLVPLASVVLRGLASCGAVGDCCGVFRVCVGHSCTADGWMDRHAPLRWGRGDRAFGFVCLSADDRHGVVHFGKSGDEPVRCGLACDRFGECADGPAFCPANYRTSVARYGADLWAVERDIGDHRLAAMAVRDLAAHPPAIGFCCGFDGGLVGR